MLNKSNENNHLSRPSFAILLVITKTLNAAWTVNVVRMETHWMRSKYLDTLVDFHLQNGETHHLLDYSDGFPHYIGGNPPRLVSPVGFQLEKIDSPYVWNSTVTCINSLN